MKFFKLTNENFLMFAVKNYTNPSCKGVDEFKRDMKHLTYISKILNKNQEVTAQKYRLLLNHIIILRNLFDGVAVSRILFFYFSPRHHPTIKTALDYIKALPPYIPEADLVMIDQDPVFQEFLKGI